MNDFNIIVGGRYRWSGGVPAGHVWVRSYDGIRVRLLTPSGPRSIKAENFLKNFEPDPVRNVPREA